MLTRKPRRPLLCCGGKGEPTLGKDHEPYIVVTDESGITDRIQALGFVAGPQSAMKALNKRCREALDASRASEIKWKDIDDGGKRRAAEAALTYLLDCPKCRAMVLTWDTDDARHKIVKRDDHANFHRMLFHGLRNVAEWHPPREWHWCPDQKTDLCEKEVQSFLNATRGERHRAEQPDFGHSERGLLSFKPPRQRCSKELPIIGLADLLAGAVVHSYKDFAGCVERRREEGGQSSLFAGHEPAPSVVNRAVLAKRRMVLHLHEQCRQRNLGVSLSDPPRLATHRRGDKIWLLHYTPQGEYDEAPTKTTRSV